MTDFTRHKRYVVAGDRPSAGQENITTRFIRRTVNQPGYAGSMEGAAQRRMFGSEPEAFFKLDPDTVVRVGEVVELYDMYNAGRGGIVYKAKKFDGSDMTPEKLIGLVTRNHVTAGKMGVCVLSQTTLAKVTELEDESETLVPGMIAGPTHDNLELSTDSVGFVILSESAFENLWLVRRVFENTTGQGSVYAGETGTPALIRLDEVSFDGGLNSWDETSEFNVVNVFSDPVEEDLHCQFKWDPQGGAAGDGAFVVTDIECVE